MTEKVLFRIARWRTGAAKPDRYDLFELIVDPDRLTVLDAMERIWAEQDRTLVFRHACHHAACGTCTIRVNGIEMLPCITPLRSVLSAGQPVQLDPLRHFPVITDLAIDLQVLYARMEQMQFSLIRAAEPLETQIESRRAVRFENCIECGACLSACPVMGKTSRYLGPAALAAAERMVAEPRVADVTSILQLVDSEDGCWRCHTAYECTEVCPSNVFPAEAIMALRRRVVWGRLKKLWGTK